jgi:hypothetical protein
MHTISFGKSLEYLSKFPELVVDVDLQSLLCWGIVNISGAESADLEPKKIQLK